MHRPHTCFDPLTLTQLIFSLNWAILRSCFFTFCSTKFLRSNGPFKENNLVKCARFMAVISQFMGRLSFGWRQLYAQGRFWRCLKASEKLQKELINCLTFGSSSHNWVGWTGDEYVVKGNYWLEWHSVSILINNILQDCYYNEFCPLIFKIGFLIKYLSIGFPPRPLLEKNFEIFSPVRLFLSNCIYCGVNALWKSSSGAVTSNKRAS